MFDRRTSIDKRDLRRFDLWVFIIAANLKFKNLQLSVQENNISGLNFWKKMGFMKLTVALVMELTIYQ